MLQCSTVLALLLRVVVAVRMSAAVVAPAAASLQERNKALVVRALHELFTLHDLSALGRYWAPDYIQHNPTFGDGPAGLRDVLSSMPDMRFEPGMIVAEGDIVMLHSRYTPGPGQTALIAADMFVVRDGRLVEHWDVLQPEVQPSKHTHGMWTNPQTEAHTL